LNGWTATELAGIAIFIAIGLLLIRYNKPAGRVLANLTDAHWPPGGLIREDRPEKIREQREFHQTAAVMGRGLVLLFGFFMLVSGAAVLINGPE
jgi:hypothetical protein